MKTRLLIVVLGICTAVIGTAGAQTSKELEKALRDQLSKQQLILRDFDGAPLVKGRWNGTDLTLGTPQWHTFGVLVASSVSVKGQRVKIAGSRRTIQHDTVYGFGLTPEGEDAEIDIDLDGDPVVLLPKLKNALFFATTREAVAAAPKWVLMPVDPRSGINTAAPNKSCSVTGEDGLAEGGDGMQHPELVKSVEAKFSDAASNAKYSANVVVGFVVDANGEKRDYWTFYPIKYGLTEQAVKATMQYTFKPATCRGTPVAVPISNVISFKIF